MTQQSFKRGFLRDSHKTVAVWTKGEKCFNAVERNVVVLKPKQAMDILRVVKKAWRNRRTVLFRHSVVQSKGKYVHKSPKMVVYL